MLGSDVVSAPLVGTHRSQLTHRLLKKHCCVPGPWDQSTREPDSTDSTDRILRPGRILHAAAALDRRCILAQGQTYSRQ